MHRRHHRWQTGPLNELAALHAHAEVTAKQRLGRGRPQQDQQVRLDHRDFGIQPGTTGVDLSGIRLLVQATLALGLPFEVLDGVRDIDMRAVDARLLERLVEHASGGTDERFSFPVLAIAGLLAHEHDQGVFGALAEDGLRARLVEVTGATTGSRLAQRRQGQLIGDLTCYWAQQEVSGRTRSPHRVSMTRRSRPCGDGPALWPGRGPAPYRERR